ncbi:MAG: GNAT family N-acetyltransferase [Gammaproteobacteria bacterium]|nr:GNAT family N-acetyltransferase [Gammaproteobacteria bacterium]MCF6261256.1 GNAT family N-acetyltransferase [Gammaproteobacteria bacterium]
MQIRKLEKKDLAGVSSLCMKAFMDSVAPSLSNEGFETFQGIASVDGFSNRMKEDNTILVYEENGKVKGVIELKEGRHVAMLFVVPDFQERGVGRALVSAITPYTRAETITVSASLNSIPAYFRYGFICAGDPDEKSGLKYQPMELELNK